MADALKLQFLIEAVDGVKGVAANITGGVRGMVRNITGSFESITHAAEGFGRSYEGIAAAIGGGLEIRDLIGQEDTFNRLRVQNDMTAASVETLRDTIVSAANDARVNLHDMLGALSGLDQAGGDITKFGEDAKTAAAMIQLLGGQGDDVGRMIAALHKQLNVDDITRSVAALYEQTKNVPGGFSQLAAQLNPLAAQYAALGHTGTDAAREIGAVYAVIANGAKSGRQAASELQNLFGSLATVEGRAHIGAALGDFSKVSAGGDIMDPRKVLPITDIVRSIAQAYQRNPTQTALMLGPQLASDLKTLIAQPGLLDQKLSATGDPRKFFDDASNASDTLAGSLNQLKTSIDQVGERWLALPFKWLTGGLNAAHGAVAALVVGLGGLSILGNVVPWFATGANNVLLLARAIGTGLVLNLGLLTEALGFSSGGILAFGAAIEATPVGWILTGIAAIAGALYGLYELWNHWKEVKESLAAGVGQVQDLGISPFTGEMLPSQRANLAPPSPSRAPAFGGTPATGAAANNQVNGNVTVTFENAPPNLTVKKAQSDNPNVDVDVNMGYGLMAVP